MHDDKKRPQVVRMPNVGESVSEVVVVRFFKRPGEPVKRDEPLVELETDKATIELTAAAHGVLASIAAEGQTIKIGDPLYALHVHGDGAPLADPAAERGPGLREWQLACDLQPLQRRAAQLAVSPTELAPTSASLLAAALVRALAAAPGLRSRVTHDPQAEVTIEHCDVEASGARWYHMSLRPDASIHAALVARRPGRWLDAGVRVIRLASPVLRAASPSSPTRGMTLALGPASAEAAGRATLTIAVAQELPAEQAVAFAEALAAQLQAV